MREGIIKNLAEELYNIIKDPLEVKDLSDDPAYFFQLEKMRKLRQSYIVNRK